MARNKAEPIKRPEISWKKAPPMMDTDYASLILGIGPDTLRRMARRGDVPAKKIGPRLWRFEKEALMAWAGVKEQRGGNR